MEFRILGPFEVCDDSGRQVRVPTGRERSLLAMLLLRRGEVVSVDALVDALWGEQPPSTAGKAVQGYVSHLRRLLEQVGRGGVLQTRPPGYLLRVDDDQVDARRFDLLAAHGWRTLEEDPAAALTTFEEALALWRGPALGEFAFAEFAQREALRLEELRLETIEGRIESMLRLGRHGAVVAELQTRVEEHPLRERLRGQLMLALYRSGRQAEALEVYRVGRRLLADELGLEPGTELQRLERAILEQDPSLEAPELAPAPTAPASGPPPSPQSSSRRSAALAPVLLAVAVAGLTLGYLLVRDDTPSTVAIVPPALVVVDPATSRIVDSIGVGSRPVTVASGAGAIWVGDARDATVTKIDPLTRTISKTIGIGAPVVDLAVGAGGVWAATGGFGEIVRIDPEIGAITDRIPLGDPDDPIVPSVVSIAVGDGRVWAGAFGGLVQVDPSTGDVVRTVDLGRSTAQQIAAGGGAVWATTIASRAKRIEASSGRETAEFYAGSWVYPVELGGGAVWVGGDGGQVWNVDPDTAAANFTARAGGGAAFGLSFGDGALWVTTAAPALVRVDPETGAVEERIPLEGVAEEVTVHGGLVWLPLQRAE